MKLTNLLMVVPMISLLLLSGCSSGRKVSSTGLPEFRYDPSSRVPLKEQKAAYERVREKWDFIARKRQGRLSPEEVISDRKEQVAYESLVNNEEERRSRRHTAAAIARGEASSDVMLMHDLNKRPDSTEDFLRGENCFNSLRSNVSYKMSELPTEIVTGIGESPEESYKDLHFKLPSIGVLQKINVNQTKRAAFNSYSESSVMKSGIKASIDHILTRPCKIRGHYAISAAMPKKLAKGMSYIPQKYEIVKRMNPAFATFSYAQKSCEGDQYTVVLGRERKVHNGKVVYQDDEVSVVCGPFLLGVGELRREIFANKYNLIIAVSTNRYAIEDQSESMNLQMIHNVMYGE